MARADDRSRADTDRLKATFDTVADSYHQRAQRMFTE